MRGKMQSGFKGGRKRQGGWVVGALAAASALTSALTGGKGARESAKASKAMKRGILRQQEEDFIDDARVRDATLGAQRARYAASGVDVNVGSVAKTLAETRSEYTRMQAANAYLTQQKLKGANVARKTAQYAAIGSYFENTAIAARGIQSAKANRSSFWD